MSDIEEEQPTQEGGRRDWNDEGDEKTSLRGNAELGGDRNLVDAHSATGSRRLSEGPRLSAGPRDERPERPEGSEGAGPGPMTQGELHRGRGDAKAGGDLSRAGERDDDDSDDRA